MHGHFGGFNDAFVRLPDGIDWYGIYGPECLGGGEDVITSKKRLWRPQLLRDFDCTVSSTWVEAENLVECHTWRAWGSRVRKKQLDYIMVPHDHVFTTWYLNKTRIRTLDHFPVVVKIEGREMRMRKEKKRVGGLDSSFTRRGEEIQRTMSRSWCDANEVSGLEALQARLEGAAVEIKATTMASRNKNKFMVEDFRALASLAAQCRDR